MIRLEDVGVAPGGDDLLRGATAHLRPGERLGVVGRNGSGKTTLMRAIVGDREPEYGKVHVRSGVKVGWLPQHAVEGSTRTVWDEASRGLADLVALEKRIGAVTERVADGDEGAIEQLERLTEEFRLAGGYALEATIGSVLHGLGFGPESWQRTCDTFSGGWQMRIALARTLLGRPQVLVLDEPTNHLDLHARSWLAQHLANGDWTLLIVSHDRYLLDRVCTGMLELRGGRLHRYAGNFSAYLGERELRAQQQQQAFEEQQEEIAKLERFVERFKAKATKASQARSRQKQLDKMEIVEQVAYEPLPKFKLPPAPPADASLLTLDRATLGWNEDTPVLQDVSLELVRGMRLAVIGPNGAGKSTFLQTLAGKLRPLGGQRRLGRRVKLGVFDQDLAAVLPSNETALDYVTGEAPRAGEPRVRSILGALGLTGDAALREIGPLSGGEKARVALACLGAVPHNILLLDEPTNHLDVVTVEVLVRALEGFDGAMVLVSHDRSLVEQLATHVARVEAGSVTIREGIRPEDLEPVAVVRVGERQKDKSGGAAHRLRKEEKRERQRLKREVERLERSLETFDERLSELDESMIRHATDFDRIRELSEQRDRVEAEQLEAMERWEQLAERLESMG